MALLELPIFPLPLVLFPGASQLLHIFEPRYREMLADCMKGDQRFGISWVDAQGKEDPAPDAGSVGCIAQVRASTALPDGRSNILTVGEERYTLLSYLNRKTPYRVGRVDTFADHPESQIDTAELGTRVSEEFRRFTAAMSALTDSMSSPPEMSEDPTSLSFQVAAAIEIEGKLKQELLAVRSTRQRLEMLQRILRSVTADLGPRAEVHMRARKNGKGGTNASIVQGG
jgi:Lon protease-like protein